MTNNHDINSNMQVINWGRIYKARETVENEDKQEAEEDEENENV